MADQHGSRQKSEIGAECKDQLIEKAKEALLHAYAPFSKFRVGAALITETGKVYSGCNVENSSYGLTNCAERTAIFAAVAAEGPLLNIKGIAILSDPPGPCAPCGACRQVIFEFGPKAEVFFQGPDGMVTLSSDELLPFGFRL
jgi:cytidine deaminase